ncbi:hypothetical protein FEZ33_00465 [Ruoffia tabacinasalis]|uniref:PrgI family protein n=1 Tax=Ruoffia tabacinasalis TaxID=87458 RepID=A0A5R9EGF5_9LACT|nr:DUF5592 family protein [Ruoffia tabacinasalis]TLQ49494.1 hypothetical protein FEZ33_00465 [Ruoffia tabacinasalis]
MNNRRLITTLSPEAKIGSWLYFTDLFAVLLGLAVFILTHELFGYLLLKAVYGIVIAIIALWSVIRPRNNPFKRNYQVVVFAFKRDKTIYHMVNKKELLFYEEEIFNQEAPLFDTTQKMK